MTNREYLQTIKRYDDEIHELKVLLRDNPDDEEIINDIIINDNEPVEFPLPVFFGFF